MTDIQRLQLRYEKGMRTIYNGMSIRGVIIGIKKKTLEECDFIPEESSKKVKVHDLDFGLDMTCTQLIDDDIIRKLKDKESEVYDLHEQFEKMRLENEALKAELVELKRIMAEKAPQEKDIEIKPKPVVVKKTILSLIDDSDEEDDVLSKSSLAVNKIANSLTPLTDDFI